MVLSYIYIYIYLYIYIYVILILVNCYRLVSLTVCLVNVTIREFVQHMTDVLVLFHAQTVDCLCETNGSMFTSCVG